MTPPECECLVPFGGYPEEAQVWVCPECGAGWLRSEGRMRWSPDPNPDSPPGVIAPCPWWKDPEPRASLEAHGRAMRARDRTFMRRAIMTDEEEAMHELVHGPLPKLHAHGMEALAEVSNGWQPIVVGGRDVTADVGQWVRPDEHDAWLADQATVTVNGLATAIANDVRITLAPIDDLFGNFGHLVNQVAPVFVSIGQSVGLLIDDISAVFRALVYGSAIPPGARSRLIQGRRCRPVVRHGRARVGPKPAGRGFTQYATRHRRR